MHKQIQLAVAVDYMVEMDTITIQLVLIPLALIVVEEVLHKPQEVFLYQAFLVPKVHLAKAEMLLVILAVEEAAAGMAAAAPMITTQTLMVVGAAVALAMYILHQLLLIIHPVVYLIHLII